MYHHGIHLALIEMKLNLRNNRLINGITYFSSNSLAKDIHSRYSRARREPYTKNVLMRETVN